MSVSPVTKYIKVFFAAVLMLTVAYSTSFAVPAAPEKLVLTQPDGSTFKARLRGDEWRHWHETEDGYTIVQDSSADWWYYAEPDGTGDIRPGVYKAGKVSPEAVNIKKGLKPVQKRFRKSSGRAQVQVLKASGLENALSFPHTQKILVILVEFTDVKHKYEASSFQPLFFDSTQKSVANYYEEVSYGKFNIIPAAETGGTNDGLVGWLQLGQSHPDCVSLGGYETMCDHDLATSAIQAAAPYVNFANFDTNGDGAITPDELSVIIVAAGYDAAYGNYYPAIWAHQDTLSSPVKLNGKSIGSYAMFGEKNGSHQATIGVMVHELGHLMLDLPDLYDTNTYPQSQGTGPFDLMSGGSWCQSSSTEYPGATPVHLSAWSKKYAGFISPSDITTQTGVSLPAVAGTSAGIVKVPTQNPSEYYLLENRHFTGYDAGLIGCLNLNFTTGDSTPGGLAVWHIDESLLSSPYSCLNSNDCQNSPSHKLVDLEEAKGGQDLDTTKGDGTLSDLFYAGNSLTFNDLTSPGSRLYDGSSSNVSISNISAYGATMTADIFTGTNPKFTITVSKSGASGTVAASDGGISCGDNCSGSYESGSSLTLTAAAGALSVFTGWGGSCSGTSATCTLKVGSQDMSVQANFETAIGVAVTKSGSGSGTVISKDKNINCGSACSAIYPSGRRVVLTEKPDANSVFKGWSGAQTCTTGSTCRLTINETLNIVAQFDRKYYTVKTVKNGTGGRIVPSGTLKIKPGQSKSLNIKANKGFSVSDVLVDGVSVGPVGLYEFSNIGADHTIEVKFIKQ